MPSIKDLIQDEPPKDKSRILQYLKRGKKGATAAGIAYDFICNKPIPIELCCYTDGEFGWRSDTIYYFEKYNIKLDEGFIKYVLN